MVSFRRVITRRETHRGRKKTKGKRQKRILRGRRRKRKADPSPTNDHPRNHANANLTLIRTHARTPPHPHLYTPTHPHTHSRTRIPVVYIHMRSVWVRPGTFRRSKRKGKKKEEGGVRRRYLHTCKNVTVTGRDLRATVRAAIWKLDYSSRSLSWSLIPNTLGNSSSVCVHMCVYYNLRISYIHDNTVSSSQAGSTHQYPSVHWIIFPLPPSAESCVFLFI